MEDWLQYGALEPFGAVRDDFRMGTIAAMYGNTHRDPEKTEARAWFDYFANAEKPKPEVEPEPVDAEFAFNVFAKRFETWAEQRNKPKGK